MAAKYLDLMLTPAVQQAQQSFYGRHQVITNAPAVDPLTDDEISFIAARDSFYLGTVSETGWPYLQHRGGPTGFLKVLSPTRLGFADLKGNRQLLTVGHLATNDRVSVFLMDYPNQTRLKLLGHAQVVDAKESSDLAEQLAPKHLLPKVERFILIDLVSFDWNCQQHITPRYSSEEISPLIVPLQARIAELEAQLVQNTQQT